MELISHRRFLFMIKFKNVTYQFPDGFRPLNNITLNISKGEKVAVVGANGSGKTTFALHINGILKAYSGQVLVSGFDPAVEAENRLLKPEVGMVFQNPDNQLITMTVEREIAFSLENQNVDFQEMRTRVDNMLELFALAKYRNKLTSELSGGEKQRLALASVLITEPSILVLDEPDSYLDQTGLDILNEAIDGLLCRQKELTLVRITQYSTVAEKCDRMILFKAGAIFREGRPDDIFSDNHLCQTAKIEVPLKYRIEHGFDFPRRDQDAGIRPSRQILTDKKIKLEDIEFGYEKGAENNLFNSLNIEIESGKIYGLVGPTGSGKSTLIQLMAGLLKPNTGKVLFDGFESKAGAVVISFQQAERQFFLNSVNDEILFGAENINSPDPQKTADECYRLVGLDKDKFAKRDPFSLSGGEKRRLSFAAILSLNPSFILFDEPICGLDYSGYELFKKLVVELKSQGKCIMIISHQGDTILELAEKVLVLDNGKLDKYESINSFFGSADYDKFLSIPELISYQQTNFSSVDCFSENQLYEKLE